MALSECDRILYYCYKFQDGVAVRVKGEMPKFYRNYCPEDAQVVVEKFLDCYFPLLDSDVDQRQLLEEMYADNANMTITYSYKMGMCMTFTFHFLYDIGGKRTNVSSYTTYYVQSCFNQTNLKRWDNYLHM